MKHFINITLLTVSKFYDKIVKFVEKTTVKFKIDPNMKIVSCMSYG